MFGISADSVIYLAFFLIVIGLTFAEAFWLTRKGWGSFAKSFVLSAVSNFIGGCIGAVILTVLILVFAAATFDGVHSHDSSLGNIGGAAVLIIAALLTILGLALSKGLLFLILNFQKGKAAWIFSLASSSLLFVLALGIPAIILDIMSRITPK